MYRWHQDNIGEFTEVDYGCTFTYRLTTNPWALEQGLKHEIDVGPAGYFSVRFGNIKKTRAYIATDSDPAGDAVLETWIIAEHEVY